MYNVKRLQVSYVRHLKSSPQYLGAMAELNILLLINLYTTFVQTVLDLQHNSILASS